MSKIIIDDLVDDTALLNDLNDRLQDVEDEFNEKVLYRDNPTGEPNEMSNDLDMAGNDILNADTVNAKTVIVDGKQFDGEVNWGGIGGDIPDQADLEARLKQAEESGVADLLVSTKELTHLGLQLDEDGSGGFAIRYTERVNKDAYGMVRLNDRGKIALDLLDMELVRILGFYRGDNLCPKAFDGGSPLTPCLAPDSRNPSEVFGEEVFDNGNAFVISFASGETGGDINLIDPANPLGNDVPTPVVMGDLIVYLDELVLGSTPVIKAGWHLWQDVVIQTTAAGTTYDPLGNIIIEPSSVNVDLALTDLDAKCETTVDVNAKDALLQTQIDTNAADIVVNEAAIVGNEARISQNEIDITTNGSAIAVNAADIDANALAITGKLPSNQFATPDGATPGIIRTTYDAATNTLNIQTS